VTRFPNPLHRPSTVAEIRRVASHKSEVPTTCQRGLLPSGRQFANCPSTSVCDWRSGIQNHAPTAKAFASNPP